MKHAVKELLICPNCLPEENRLQTQISQEQDQDILTGQMRCPACARVYPIQQGIAYLDPRHGPDSGSRSKYETPSVLASYLWSHFADLLQDPEASLAYRHWVDLVQPHPGLCLDIGAAVGRFVLEMAAKCDFALGVDNSVAFVKTARELLLQGSITFCLPMEGHLSREVRLELPPAWPRDKAEFIVADAQALPFASSCFASLSSLNMLDKVSGPLRHLQEMDRVAQEKGVQCLISDPFSWSAEASRPELWLGGRQQGQFPGLGLDNVQGLLQSNNGYLSLPWTIQARDHVWWKLRTHANHFELIRSCYIQAKR
ncbi:MAG: methyltransferase domain-containing protein [Desulfohalobiaceae bacterium]